MANKSCVYLVKDIKNKKYYVGSHKQSDDLGTTYTTSSEPLNSAIEEFGADNFEWTVLRGGLHRQDAYQIEKNLLSAANVADDSSSYNQTETVLAPKEGFFSKLFRKMVTNTADELTNWLDMIADIKSSKSKSVEGNDFNFESNLGLFLESGFDAFAAEGERQGYDDPSKDNWDKQVDLLKVQLDNNIQREIFIKNNKHTQLQAALNATDSIVTNMVEFQMALQKASNELEYIKDQAEQAKAEKGWYLMLHEALHDGFQDGAKKRLAELTENIL